MRRHPILTPEEKRARKAKYDRERYQTIEVKYKKDIVGAKRRGYSWGLSIEQAGFCYTQPCHYCGEAPNGKLNGIDRQDNNVGYTAENCVPCCPTCNYTKCKMSSDEFVWLCKKIAQYNKK
jgi:hypothetical protein